MPSKSWRQHKFFEAIKHSPSFAKEAGVPQNVGRDFANADDKAGITKSHEGQRHASYAHGGTVGNKSKRYHKGWMDNDNDAGHEPDNDADDWE